MNKKCRKRAYVTVEAAAVLGLYLTILGTLMGWGFKLYQAGAKILEQSVEMEHVKDICDKKRQLELLEEIQKN